jgi:hypothetical protein
MKNCQSQQIFNLLQEDSLQQTKQSVSIVELSRFHSLMDHQKQLMRPKRLLNIFCLILHIFEYSPFSA